MPADHPTKSAEIIQFPLPRAAANIFTARDRVELMEWEAKACGGIRLFIHKRYEGDPPEVGEFASIYPANARWAAWGAVRQGREISVWRARDGQDVGRFETMGEVLAMLAAMLAEGSASDRQLG